MYIISIADFDDDKDASGRRVSIPVIQPSREPVRSCLQLFPD